MEAVAFGTRRKLGGKGGATGIGRGDILTEKIVNLRCRFGGYVAYRVCPQVSLSLGLRQGVYCLRRHLRRLSLCKFRRRAVCVVDKRSVGSRSVVSGGIFHLASWRIFSSCAVWPALVCTLEILLGLLTSARRYVLIKVGVAEAPLFTPRTLVCVPCAFDALFYFAKPFQSGKKQLRYFCLYATIHK